MSTSSEKMAVEKQNEEIVLKNKCKKIYVMCPANYASGGPDALHQMVFYLRRMGFEASIAYFDTFSTGKYAIPVVYKKYVTSFLTENEIVDSLDSVIVLPETFAYKRDGYKKSCILIWWLSVDNNKRGSSFLEKCIFFLTLPARIVKNFAYYRKHFSEAVVKTIRKELYSFKNEQKNVEHICASYYAFDYVSKKSKKEVKLCIEPISKYFLECYEKNKENILKKMRSNEIIYNPAKSSKFVNKLAAYAPDLKFVPLRGMSQDQLIDKYMSSKLYVDFGPFPGAERMPKEAVLFGCTIITGRRGASNFHGDVPIPDEYKFENPEKQMDDIVQKLRFMLKNYEKINSDFDEYRNTVLNLERNFIESLKKVFGQNRISGENV